VWAGAVKPFVIGAVSSGEVGEVGKVKVIGEMGVRWECRRGCVWLEKDVMTGEGRGWENGVDIERVCE
jgi:hypothetical protein